MGSQQLLLILVGMIVVGLMVVAGFSVLRSYHEATNRDQLISTLNNLALLAQQYYKKPAEQGGGGGSFEKFIIPHQLTSTEAGSFKSNVRATRIDFLADGVEIGRNEKTVVSVTARVDKDEIRFTIIN